MINEVTADKRPHILVVDDSRLMRRAITKILGKEYRLTEASDGEEGWKILQEQEDIQIIFSDLSMPNLDGYGLLERIRNSDIPRIQNVPVIIITGAEDDEETKQRALARGASDFISKPFESIQLRTRTTTHLRLDSTHRQLNETANQLEEQTSRDELTGLANKNYFQQHANKELAFAKRHHGELSILLIQVDNFNKLFTSFGKDAASHVLKEVGHIMLENVRHEDTVARIGVAQLAFLMPSINRIGARQLAERIRKQIEELNIVYDNTTLPTTISAGIAAVAIQRDTSLNEIMDVAKEYLRTALERTNCVVFKEASDSPMEEAAPVGTTSTDASAVTITEAPDLETATALANSDDSATLQPHLSALLERLLPLLDYCNRHLQLGIDEALEKIRQHVRRRD
ncbi:diguanylate cyclase domain-containing protein [Sulfuriflexus mobilis]|uniref:GGDEF domain-containing response regulator n=1 Tax=Sulfuriflexus mobilis TaxID=1811807 RepID=UPI00155906E0|nr:diguanylate cyclase [Sulfuriflexus mobilis]